jgi:hypothetical protein
MGATLVNVTTNSNGVIDCKTDADCFAASTKNGGAIVVASTAADKATRCCMYYELMKPPGNKAGGDILKSYKTDYGLDLKPGFYTKACNNNYPT